MKFIVAVSLFLFQIVNSETPQRRLRGPPHGEKVGGKTNQAEACLICNVKRADIQYKEGYDGERSDYWVCETDAADEPDGSANRIYMLDDLPQSFIDTHKGRLDNGKARICIPNGKANRSNHKIEFSKDASPKYLGERDDGKPDRHGHRQLMKATGKHTVLAVMISSSTTGETDPNTNSAILAGNLFGTGSMAQTVNVASQYKACSNGKLQIVPYTNKAVTNGILSVKVGIAIKGNPTLTTIQNAVIKATQTALNVSDIRYSADHVLFCLPQGGLIKGTNLWVSYGYINGAMSFHQYSMCTRLSAPMHEMGHNNGFYHSGNGTDEYGDRSGFMGYAYQFTGHPLMCYNAHKNYISGWFDDRKISVNPVANGAWGGTLIAPADHDAAVGLLPKAVNVVNVGKFYLQLNSAKKFNNETKSNPNRVNIVSADLPSNPNTISWIAASLAAGETFTFANYAGTSTLVVQVCNITFGTIDTATVSIYLNNGIQMSQCGKIS